MPKRYIAMWSGPRNISTAMMRAWGSRQDTAVIDEPFYAHYLKQTGSPHPGAAQIMTSQSTDWREVVKQITTIIPGQKSVYYQKHITTHMLEHISLNWLAHLTHCFLIRSPRKVVASYSLKRADTASVDLGYAQQYRIYQYVCENLAAEPVVIDSDLFLQNPKAQLHMLCKYSGLDYTDNMLSWEPGIRETDGIWHPHWYAAVAKSTGFNTYRETNPDLTPVQEKIANECERYYQPMRAQALTTSSQPD